MRARYNRAWLSRGVSPRSSNAKAKGTSPRAAEYDVASQGDTIEEARANVIEALTLFFECAEPAELSRRLKPEVFVTQVEVEVA